MAMDMDGRFHIHGNPASFSHSKDRYEGVQKSKVSHVTMTPTPYDLLLHSFGWDPQPSVSTQYFKFPAAVIAEICIEAVHMGTFFLSPPPSGCGG